MSAQTKTKQETSQHTFKPQSLASMKRRFHLALQTAYAPHAPELSDDIVSSDHLFDFHDGFRVVVYRAKLWDDFIIVTGTNFSEPRKSTVYLIAKTITNFMAVSEGQFSEIYDLTLEDDIVVIAYKATGQLPINRIAC